MSVKNLIMSAAGASTDNPNAWDISYAVYDAGPDAGDVSKAFHTGRISPVLSSQESSATGMFISTDGAKFYYIGGQNDTVYQYTMSSPWIVNTAVYDSKSFSVATQDNDPQGLSFKTDGTKMYVIGKQNDTIYQYSLATAWDVSTSSYDSVSFSVATQEVLPTAVTFKPDGTKMYVVGTSNDTVYEYDLSSAWDLSSASYLQSFSVATQETNPKGISFLGDGTKMYVIGTTGDDVNEYDLSTPWDISSASFVQSFSVSALTLGPEDLFFKPDGSTFFVLIGLNSANNPESRVFQYGIGGFNVAAQETNPTGIFFKPDGTKMYIAGSSDDDINEYSLSTAWDITTASYLQNFSVAAQDNTPEDLFFKPDGTKMYVVARSSPQVLEYSLSSAWDISSASYTQNLVISAQDLFPTGLFFKDDGTKMYVSGNTGDDINEYSLSTAWNISTASFTTNFSVASQEVTPQGLSFKTDGTKMYVVGSTGDDVNEYNLSSAWDISTATFVQNAGVIELSPTGLYWREDGEEFFIVGFNGDRVLKYTISST
jgi:DNA-binding beta-propeller fold protein YncE